MCARYSISATRDQLLEAFSWVEGGSWPNDLLPLYNVAPSLVVPAFAQWQQGMSGVVWGLDPWWESKTPLINITLENLYTRRTFHPLLKGRRIAMPATGFFEWMTEGRRKLPEHFGRRDGLPFCFAGLSKVGVEGADEAALITTTPNRMVVRVHNRMPLMLSPEQTRAWLEAESVDEALAALQPIREEEMTSWPVSPEVNRTAFQLPSAVLPWQETPESNQPSLFGPT